jgi:hypothetical protein
MVCSTEVLEYIVAIGYCSIVMLCTVMEDYPTISLETVVHYTMVVLQTVARDCTVVLCIVILQLLRIFSCYMFIMHPVCICNLFFHHIQGSIVLVFVSN